jgi:hypothetical protein
MVAGEVTIYSDGFASSSAPYLISTGTRFDVNGQIFAGFGATGMGASGWVVTSQDWYCVFGPWAPF